MIKKAFYLLLIIILTLSQGGCWSRREMSEIAIVLGAGVDRAPDGKIILSLQIARPTAFATGGKQPSGAQQNNVWFISEAGKTVLEAQRHLEAKVSREIYWGHTVVLVIGEEMAREGIRKVINFFSRSPSTRETIWVLVTKGKAADVLNSHSQLENTSAQSAGAMIRAGVSMPVMLKDLSMMLASEGTNPVLPGIELTPSGAPQGPGMKENIPAARDTQQQFTAIHAEITINGTGVFKDEKLVGWLDMSETRGLLWLKNEMKKGVITVSSPVEPGRNISIHFARANTKVEPFYDGQNIWFDVKIKMEGELWEQQSAEDITEPEIFKAIEKETARNITARVRTVVKKAQLDYGIDIFAFGETFHRKYKKEWATLKDRWDEEFANADVNITTQAHIRRTGLTTKRISKP